MEPIGHRRQGLTGVEALRHVIDEALDERGDREDLLERRQSVADADLDGAPVRCGADVPADLVDVVDDSGGEHIVDVLLVVRPLIELERQTCRRQLLEHHRPVRGIAGVRAAPERRRRGQRLQVRDIGEQCVDDRQHLVARVDADVDMDTEDQHVPTPPLGAVDEFEVTVLRSDLLRLPLRERVGARRHQFDSARFGELPHSTHRGGQILGDGRHLGMDTGDELDRVRQHLTDDLLLELGRVLGHIRQQSLGSRGQVQAARVQQSQFPLDTEGGAGRACEIDHDPIIIARARFPGLGGQIRAV